MSQKRSPVYWKQISLRSLVILLAIAPLGFWLLRGFFVSQDIYENVEYSKFVSVGVIDPQQADHVMDLLDGQRIPNLVEGSVAYGVSVPPEHRQRAADILKRDSQQNGYRLITE